MENKVKSTIERFNLINPTDKIAVAVSGGKDSQTVLSILNALYPTQVTGIAIDEGIPDYRDHTLKDLKSFCKPRNIPYTIYSFEQAYGKTLTQFIKQRAPSCRTCGVLRRTLLNRASKDFDKLATGHNLDDECQSILMNLLKGNLFLLAKLGPLSGITKLSGFTPRIKPLYLVSEKETTAYAYLNNFPVTFSECPYSSDTFRSHVRDSLNEWEHVQPGTKNAIMTNFLVLLPRLRQKYKDVHKPSACTRCGSPSAGALCKACELVIAYAD